MPPEDEDESRRQILIRRAKYVALGLAAAGVGGAAVLRHCGQKVQAAACLSMSHMESFEPVPPKQDGDR